MTYSKNVDLFHLLFATILILAEYSYGSFYFSYFVLVLLAFVSYHKEHRIWRQKAFVWMTAFFIVHDIILYFTMGSVPQTYRGLLLGLVINLGSIILIIPRIRFESLYKALKVVSVIAITGILFQSIQVFMGMNVSTLRIPFLPNPLTPDAIHWGNRPMSFFSEPSAFAIFQLPILFFSIVKKEYFFSVISVIALLLSGSSSAIIGVLLLILFYAVEGKGVKGLFITIPLVIIIVWTVFNLSFFSAGADRIIGHFEDLTQNDRLFNGFLIAPHVPINNWILGVNYISVSDFVNGQRIGGFVIPLTEGSDLVFVSDFWTILFRYGIVGLLLYIGSYYSLYRKNKSIGPYIFMVILSLFFSGASTNTYFVYQYILAACFVKDYHVNEKVYS